MRRSAPRSASLLRLRRPRRSLWESASSRRRPIWIVLCSGNGSRPRTCGRRTCATTFRPPGRPHSAASAPWLRATRRCGRPRRDQQPALTSLLDRYQRIAPLSTTCSTSRSSTAVIAIFVRISRGAVGPDPRCRHRYPAEHRLLPAGTSVDGIDLAQRCSPERIARGRQSVGRSNSTRWT